MRERFSSQSLRLKQFLLFINFHFKNKLSAIPKLSSERFVQIDEGPFAFPEFSLRKNALLRPRPRPTASTLADRIRT